MWWAGNDPAEMQAANGAGPEREDASAAILRDRQRENERLVAVYAAREQRTRMVEGRGDGWRTGRACSLAEWKAARGEAWQVVVPRRAPRHDTKMKLGAKIEIMEEGKWQVYTLRVVDEVVEHQQRVHL